MIDTKNSFSIQHGTFKIKFMDVKLKHRIFNENRLNGAVPHSNFLSFGFVSGARIELNREN